MNDADPNDPLSKAFVPVCAIGASAGGIAALQGLFRHLPNDLGLAYVVILHLAPDQPSALGEILSVCTRMLVLEIEDAPTLRPNCVYVIPPDRELVIDGDSVTARPFSEPRGQRAQIDTFLRSIATGRGDGIAVVLSGAGSDGAAGARAVKEAGGVIMVQEPAEAGFGSMPQNAIATGVADFVAPVARLAEHVAEVARSKEAVRSLDSDRSANDLRRIVAFLRARTGHDFAGYKRATVMRRVLRRMQVCRVDTLSGYADYLLATPEETRDLFADLLISVTQFFRDPRAFDALRGKAVRLIFDDLDLNPATEDGIRVWVVGCATGEEAYSMAILLHEEAARRKSIVRLQIFASDLDESALAIAREGRYPRSIESDVSQEHLSRFFIDEGAHYRVRKELRDSVLFASHSVIREPPFMRLDLITCRNLLIYMERSLQAQLCGIFHYGLKPGRFLFLGSADTVDAATDLFTVVDREARVYSARPQSVHALPVLPQLAVPHRQRDAGQVPSMRGGSAEPPASLHMAALERGAPASALVDDGQNILHLSPNAGRFIRHSGGPISNSLPAVVRPELRLDLRLALTRAFDRKETILTHPAVVAFDDGRRRVTMQVSSVPNDANLGAQALVFFMESGLIEDDAVQDTAADSRPEEVRRLHAELKAAQEALVASKIGHEASIQDLRAANEELQSINEEYRSTAEELETSKEELQSINEELHTVNAELKSKLQSISVAHNDLQNLTAATEIGTLFIDGDMRIKMFTPPIADVFNITTKDIGRAIGDFTHKLDYRDIETDVGQILAHLAPIEREVHSHAGRSYVMRLRPYRTVENRIDGAVLTLVDITARLQAEAALSRSERQLRALIRASSQVLYRMSPSWDEMRELLGGGFLSNTDHPDESWLDHYIPEDDRANVRAVIDEAVATKGVFDLEHRVRRIDGTIGWTQSRAIPFFDNENNIVEWFGSATDVTLRKRAEEDLRESQERLRVLIEGVPQLVWRAVESGRWTWSSPQWHAYSGLSEKESRDHGWQAAVHPDDRDRVMEAWHWAVDGHVLEVECRIANVEAKRYRWFQSRATPVRDSAGRTIEWLGTSTDVDDLRRMQERQRVLVAELQHRTRNLLGVVRSIAGETIATSTSLPGFQTAFNGRLAALSRVQGLLSRSDDEPITLGALIRSELDALGANEMVGRVVARGPNVQLRKGSVQTLALALHELATNARKYGALASDAGQLRISWNSYESKTGQRLALDWREGGFDRGHGIPKANGYGRELIERALPYALQARTTYDLGDTELVCTIDLPLTEGMVGDHLDARDH